MLTRRSRALQSQAEPTAETAAADGRCLVFEGRGATSGSTVLSPDFSQVLLRAVGRDCAPAPAVSTDPSPSPGPGAGAGAPPGPGTAGVPPTKRAGPA